MVKRAKAGAKTKAASAPPPAEEPCAKKARVGVDASTPSPIDCKISLELHKYLTKIEEAWPGIQDKPTLAITDGAPLCAFKQTDFQARMADGRPHKCCCSLFVLNLMSVGKNQPPLCSRKVDELVAMLYPCAPVIDEVPAMTVRVKTKNADVLQLHWGTLELVSPLEPLVALLRACYRDVTNDSSPDVLDAWERALRAIQMGFFHFDDEEQAFLHGVQLRQTAMQCGVSLTRTPLQWACELVAFRDTLVVERNGSKTAPSAALVAEKFKAVRFLQQLKFRRRHSSKMCSPSTAGCSMCLPSKQHF